MVGMGRVSFAFVLSLALAACTPRGTLVVDPAAASVGTVESVFIGTTRGIDPKSGDDFGRERRHSARYTRLDVSIPPEREPGEIHWPSPHRTADPLDLMADLLGMLAFWWLGRCMASTMCVNAPRDPRDPRETHDVRSKPASPT